MVYAYTNGATKVALRGPGYKSQGLTLAMKTASRPKLAEHMHDIIVRMFIASALPRTLTSMLV